MKLPLSSQTYKNTPKLRNFRNEPKFSIQAQDLLIRLYFILFLVFLLISHFLFDFSYFLIFLEFLSFSCFSHFCRIQIFNVGARWVVYTMYTVQGSRIFLTKENHQHTQLAVVEANTPGPSTVTNT